MSADPPYDKKGKGIPVRGSKRVCAERFITICVPKKTVIAPAKSFPNISGAFIAILIPLQTIKVKIKIMKREPRSPVSSAIIAKIESVVLSGMYAYF